MLGIFLDTETNGLDSQAACPLEIALAVVDLKSGVRHAQLGSFIRVSPEEWAKSDPNSLKINEINFDQVAAAPTRQEVGNLILARLLECGIERGKAVFICQNPSFDRAFFNQLIPVDTQEALHWPYHWLDFASMFWATLVKQGEIPVEISLSKDAIAARFSLPPEVSPHRARNGVEHLLLCYRTVIGFE